MHITGVSDWRINGGKVFVDEDDNKKLVDFWEVRHARENGSMAIIDVRNPKERILPGAIKKTINIPCQYFKLHLNYLFDFCK